MKKRVKRRSRVRSIKVKRVGKGRDVRLSKGNQINRNQKRMSRERDVKERSVSGERDVGTKKSHQKELPRDINVKRIGSQVVWLRSFL